MSDKSKPIMCEGEDCENVAEFYDINDYVVCGECMNKDIYEDDRSYRDYTEIKKY